jgi:N-methylhydantoinase A
VAQEFETAHEREYFYRFEDQPVQIVHLRSYAIGVMPKLEMAVVAPGSGRVAPEALLDRRTVLFAVDGERVPHETPFYERTALRAGDSVGGPAGPCAETDGVQPRRAAG